MRRLFVPLAVAVFLFCPAAAQQPAGDSAYVRTDTLIPMRDGIRLFTVIVVPRGTGAGGGPLPILMTRTPYEASGNAGMARRANELGLGGYILVFQDIRGRFRSEGTFDMNRPPRSGHAGTDESTDTYDTIDWLVKHVPNNNGRAGIFGVSYPGWLTAVAGIGAHPALKAISPQAPMGDTWMGDDFFHQGAFRLTYGLEYAWMMEASNDLSVEPSPARYDTFEWYLSFPTLGALARAVGANKWPSWRRFVAHPAYDSAWQARALPRYFTHTTVPTLTVGGWWGPGGQVRAARELRRARAHRHGGDQSSRDGPLVPRAVVQRLGGGARQHPVRAGDGRGLPGAPVQVVRLLAQGRRRREGRRGDAVRRPPPPRPPRGATSTSPRKSVV